MDCVCIVVGVKLESDVFFDYVKENYGYAHLYMYMLLSFLAKERSAHRHL